MVQLSLYILYSASLIQLPTTPENIHESQDVVEECLQFYSEQEKVQQDVVEQWFPDSFDMDLFNHFHPDPEPVRQQPIDNVFDLDQNLIEPDPEPVRQHPTDKVFDLDQNLAQPDPEAVLQQPIDKVFDLHHKIAVPGNDERIQEGRGKREPLNQKKRMLHQESNFFARCVTRRIHMLTI